MCQGGSIGQYLSVQFHLSTHDVPSWLMLIRLTEVKPVWSQCCWYYNPCWVRQRAFIQRPVAWLLSFECYQGSSVLLLVPIVSLIWSDNHHVPPWRHFFCRTTWLIGQVNGVIYEWRFALGCGTRLHILLLMQDLFRVVGARYQRRCWLRAIYVHVFHL